MITRALRAEPLPGAADEIPTSFRIFVFGNNSSDQGDFNFDQKSAEAVMAEWRKQNRDLVIDYEHQSNVNPPIKAIAAGWFVPEVREDGLYAINVRWTAEARDELARKHYRFFSPTFDYDRKSNRIVTIRNIGLTNSPSLYGMTALVAARSGSPTQLPLASLEAQLNTLIDKAIAAGRVDSWDRVSLRRRALAFSESADAVEWLGGLLDAIRPTTTNPEGRTITPMSNTNTIALKTLTVNPGRESDDVIVCSTKFGEIRIGKGSHLAVLLKRNQLDEFEKQVNFAAEHEKQEAAVTALRNAGL